MEKREFKHEVYGGIGQLTKALANPHRLEIIDLLAQGEKMVEAIATEIDVSIANASQHLQVLKQARLVTIRKQGHYMFYTLANADVFAVWQALRGLSISQLPDVEKVIRDYRTGQGALKGISLNVLIGKLERDEVILLDVRPAEEYRMGHIPNALSVPPGEWGQKLEGLPTGEEVIAYCRGPFCVFADEAVAYLKSKGYRAARLDEGFPDWKIRGLPVICG
ncbi:ArsR/SmtB family transcription factor [Spirosoma spitsbergense]|uniref:ArsR/SmtB family transcription factor n=1 Tax=Spirosoma spitsbergense TaxID=431554 RepID=UPI00037557B3|nr:metalloregulator ArsR/SmtB family transcription factor [Spirosoma spitsbergense]